MTYSCNSCGYRCAQWMGFCPRCRSADELVRRPGASGHRPLETPEALPLSEAGPASVLRLAAGIGELDRVLGGGFVSGSAVLLGGEPGVGKSTLVLQTAAALAGSGSRVLIATAEESAEQVGLRADRLGIDTDGVLLLAESSVEAIMGTADRLRPDLVVVDSVQTVGIAELVGAPGSVSQVRESAARFMRYAKDSGTTTVLIGHVTKDGGIAGPKMLEHMVDVVLYLEGESGSGLRGLRSLKNRFGATHLMGFFEMAGEGLREVKDPSATFLADWRGAVSGTVAFPTVEGRRPVLVEVQALVSPTTLPQPRRSVRGVDPSRVHQMMAVLNRHAGLKFSDQEVYVNVVGGMRLSEPAADLPVALALASSRLDRPLGPLAAWGEVGLTGELRAVSHEGRRSEEVGRLGVKRSVAARAGDRRGIRDALDLAVPGWRKG